MKKVAIMIDGGFFSKIFKDAKKSAPVPADVLKLAQSITGTDDLFRIYYYDCPPYDKPLQNPIDKSPYTAAAYTQANKVFQADLAKMDYVAFRSGTLKCHGWKLNNSIHKQLQMGQFKGTVEAKHLTPDFKQKGVDMRIGLDIAHLSTKKIVDKIAIVTGDTDFIPAMKYARKEGMLIVFVNIKGHLVANPYQGIDQEILKHADKTIEIDLLKI